MGFLQVLEDSRTVLIAADVLPDGPVPQDEKLKDGMVSPTPPLAPYSLLFSSCSFYVLITHPLGISLCDT